MSLLSVENLVAGYGGSRVLHGVTFSVADPSALYDEARPLLEEALALRQRPGRQAGERKRGGALQQAAALQRFRIVVLIVGHSALLAG